MISDNIRTVLEKIEKAKIKSGRKDAVTLIAVTKTVSTDKMIEAINSGITDIGENKIQEAVWKFPELIRLSDLKKHFIGHLQTNKVKKAVELFDIIQSVDSIRLLEEINSQAQKISKIQNCFIEVKVSEEETKHGIQQKDINSLLEKSKILKNIKFSGVMAMAPFFENPELARPYFRKAREIFDSLSPLYDFKFLSMGMTNDFEIAVEEGSTMVRIGTGIFGGRS